MTEKEKAKRYDEALEIAGDIYNGNPSSATAKVVCEQIFPELKESEDERIRKNIKIALMSMEDNLVDFYSTHHTSQKELIAWREKQGEQILVNIDLYELVIQLEETIGTSPHSRETIKDFFQKAVQKYMNCLKIANGEIGRLVEENYRLKERQGEQNPVPKFKVGDKIRRKTPSSFDKDMEVARIDKDYYVCNHIGKFSSEVVLFSKEDSYELVEQPTDNDIKEALRTEYEKGRADAIAEVQKSAWSEDDDDNMLMIEDRLSDYLDYIREDSSLTKHRKNSLKEEVIGYVKWLKSLKGRVQPQNTWKPSKEQMLALKEVEGIVGCLAIIGEQIKSLYQDLKKLREE